MQIFDTMFVGRSDSAARRKSSLLISVACGMCAVYTPAHAQVRLNTKGAASAPAAVTAKVVSLNIPTQDLERALLTLTRQAAVQLVANAADLRGLKSAPVVGRLSPDRAVRIMLGSLPLAAEWLGNDTLMIQRRAASFRTAAVTVSAQAPQAPSPASLSGEADETDDIVVTATKQAGATTQSVPLAITAFGQEQLERAQLRNINSLSISIPNVQLGTSSSLPGNMNFAIRGLGTFGALPSVDPQVGLFIDGVYVGLTLGAITDMFDTEAVEVLRGPQGVLFGKNVTGGAVLVRTTTPKNDFYVDANASIETGLNYTGSVVLSGPIIQDKLSFKVAGYYNKDEGWFKDAIDGDPIGGSRTWVGRVALRFQPSDAIDIVARYEHGDLDSNQDTPVQNTVKYPTGFKMEDSGDAYAWNKWDNATVEANIDLGGGTLTNIAGWRWVDYETSFEIDGLNARINNSDVGTKQHQFSDELRYATKLGTIDLTTGLYYFTQDFQFAETRRIGSGFASTAYSSFFTDGGIQKQHTYGIFGAIDWHVSDTFTINLGARYTKEKKRVKVATLGGGAIGSPLSPCVFATVHSKLNCRFDFQGSNTSNGFTPKIGFQWQPTNDTQVYGSWTIGIRGGGYNLRNTLKGIPAGPYDDEKNYSMELGLKTDLDDGRVRINAAVFRSKLHSIQRDRLFIDPVVGSGSITDNVGSATFQGVEVESTVRPLKGLTFNGYLGIIDASYDKLTADLNRDGVVNGTDLNLKIVRVPPLSWGVGATYGHDLGSIGTGFARIQYGYKDRQALLDNNLAFATAYKSLNASISVATMDDRLTFSVYGKNLTDHRNTVSANVLPASFGGGYAVLEKGRVVGASVRFKLQ